MSRLCQPEKVIWLDGSPSEKKQLEKWGLNKGELVKLHPKKLPGCFYHHSAINDVARVEQLTFICTKKKENTGATNNWMAPQKAYRKAGKYFKGSMIGRTMYVIPFTMGLPSSPFAKVGVQLTDSVYVALNMRIMTHMGKPALKLLDKGAPFTKCLHSTADLNIKHRLILHFPEDNTIWSVGSGYGGNALLGKKCMALRIASFLGKREGWMAEHMLILGVQNPKGAVKYIAAAFPSACGKTNLAMINPPKKYQKQGYKIWTVGDDIAWLRIGADGHLYAVNPENGMFGVAPGTNTKTNKNATRAVKKNTIFTNVLLKKDGTVWWEGGDGAAPTSGTNWEGRPWKQGQKNVGGKPVRGAHPNSRFTTPIQQCPTFSQKFYDPNGVKISALIFGGRHADLSPLVFESKGWQHGVYVGAAVSSELTAAQAGKIGQVRRDPMAMIPFCGYNIGDYFQHWLDMGKSLKNPPRIFHVNWFRKKKGKFLWPGFGDNFRVLLWILDRCQYKKPADKNIFGYVPRRKDLDLEGLRISDRIWKNLFSTSKTSLIRDLESQEQFFNKIGKTLPKELWRRLKELKAAAFSL